LRHLGKGEIVLILSRRIGEKLIIGDNVTVTILAVKGNQVRIGIEAPRNVRVDREEVHERILKEEEERRNSEWPAASAAGGKGPLRTLSISGK
jgi:carbon storage regulator